MFKNFFKKVIFELLKKDKGVLSNPDFFSPLKKLNRFYIYSFEIDCSSLVHFLTDVSSFSINSAQFDHFTWRKVGHYNGRRPDSEVLK